MDPEEGKGAHNPLWLTSDPQIARALIDAGAHPSKLTSDTRRLLIGIQAEASPNLLNITTEQFESGRCRYFGTTNPELVDDPFCYAMFRAGVAGETAWDAFHNPTPDTRDPVWCADRFGQSITFLPDGRIIQIGGEHEDSYDPDFRIYNDVFVHEPDRSFGIYAYPEDSFPPTDFHTATLIGDHIYVIGSLGYQGRREFGTTPVYRLHTRSLQIERITVGGEGPGWIYGHKARSVSATQILVTGGQVAKWTADGETHSKNLRGFVFDVSGGAWRTEP